MGEGILSDDAKQTLSSVVLPGQTQTFLVHIKNTGTNTVPFRVNLNGLLSSTGSDTAWNPQGWTVVAMVEGDTTHTDISTSLRSAGGWTTPAIAQGSEKIVRLSFTSPATTAPPVPRGSFRLVARSGNQSDAVIGVLATQSLANVQWSRDGLTWSDAPLTAEQFESIAFRAVLTDPTISWDDLPDFNPVWTEQGATHWGEVVWIHFPTLGTTSISAECGNSRTVTVQVVDSLQ